MKDGIYIDSNFQLHYPEGASMLDDFPDDLRDVVHEFWGRFPPQHPLISDGFGLLFFFLWMMSTFGNGLVIYIFLSTKTLRTASNIFIVNLAFSDLMMMTTQALPVGINAFASDSWIWSSFGCKLYACLGGIFGTNSLLSMVVIGYDRYNIIVKGMNGPRITPLKAFIILFIVLSYSTLICIPPFLGWGGYALEGLLITCSYDYLSEDWMKKSFVLYAFIGNYCIPMLCAIYFYSRIVVAVVKHEANLRKQAKKMNVDSLRAGDQQGDSAEVKIAKVAITNVMLWAVTWTPYASVVMMGAFGPRENTPLSPMMSQMPAFLAKMASCFNPMIFAMAHPKYREALAEKVPCLGIELDQPKKKAEG